MLRVTERCQLQPQYGTGGRALTAWEKVADSLCGDEGEQRGILTAPTIGFGYGRFDFGIHEREGLKG